MSNIKAIRARLSLTQEQFAQGIGCTQANVWQMEQRGQAVPPDRAEKVIAFAASKGLRITYDDIYGEPVKTRAKTKVA